MILISHRGNINGRIIGFENKPEYILDTIKLGFHVEIDVWFVDNSFYLGHDEPEYKIEPFFLRNEFFWCHAKNLDALIEMKKYDFHYFWHEHDKHTITSKGYIWSYPSEPENKNTICVLPELYGVEPKNCLGICSDFIGRYKN